MLILKTTLKRKRGDLMILMIVETGPFDKNCLFDILIAEVTVMISLFDQLVG